MSVESRASARRFVVAGVVSRAACAVELLEPRQVMASAAGVVVDSAGGLTVDNFVLPQKKLYTGTALTKAAKGDIAAIAVSYLKSHAADFGLLAGDVAAPIVTDKYTDADTGIGHVYLRQSLNGLPIVSADMVVNLMPDGSVISAGGSFVPNLAKSARGVKGPKVTAGGALVAAAGQLKINAKATSYTVKSSSQKGEWLTRLSAPTISQGTVNAVLRYVPTAAGLKLAWSFAVNKLDNSHWYNVAVGGDNSQIVYSSDWVDEASYNVVARPSASPTDGGFAVVTNPQDAVASPYGWHDTNGVAGAEFTNTVGNNVDAHLDRVDDDIPDGTRPDGTAALNFTGANFTQAPASAPTTTINQNVAQTNLFYANNVSHDLFYKYGFTEAAGNFQTNTYGRGGTGSDAVQADAQDGGGTDNANFATPPDGTAGRMQMYLFTAPTPDRDGDLDMEVVYHEYGHGVSNRLTGGPANADALNTLQSGGMGEGWSDFFALMFTQKSTDTATTSQPVGTYVLGQASTGTGIRRYPYNYNMAVNPLTIDAYGAVGTSTAGGGSVTRSMEVHDTGEIWTAALWDMNWLLVNKYGFDANLQNGLNPAGIKGNTLAMKLVMDALKLQPANPSFKDARDAILQADANLHATLGTPSNATEIWAAFARRGMGVGFVNNNSFDDAVTASFAVPVADPTVVSTTPGNATLSPFSTVDIRFDQPMNTGSFSVASDVVSFTAPGGANLVPAISGFTWTAPNTLRLNLSGTQTTRGVYTLVIGPNILAEDDGHAMDANRNGTPGEAVADRATVTLNLTDAVGPDGFGYKTAAYPYESLNLTIGGAGVTTLLNASDDGSSAVALGANTFNFYGTTYTAGQIFAGVNGLITFGSANTSYVNDAFGTGTSVSQRAIAPWWGDFRTDTNGSGGTDSALLYQVDTANNRLIIEWSDVASYYGAGPTTFQAILQLNTGATPGRIIFNYPDMDMNNYGSFGGVGTFGIKDSGTPTVNRLLLDMDGPHPWLNNGLAVETALDVTAPKVTAEAFNVVNNQSFTVTFSEDVGASLSLADFVLTNTTTATVVSAANLAYAYNAGTRTATITKTGGILANGNYTLAIASAGVTDAVGNPLDGNGDGVIGGNHAFATFVLAGDANRDRTVDFNDFLALQTHYNTAQADFTKGDFNYNGVIDFNDFLILQTNYGVTV